MKQPLIATLAFALLASVAAANDHGPGGPPPGDFGRGPAGDAVVGSDGSLYIVKITETAGSASSSVEAIRPSGVVAFTVALPSARGRLVLSDGNLIQNVVTRASDGTFSSALTAISTSSGATAWTRTISGEVFDLIPFSGGTYAVVVIPPTTTGGTATRSLSAIGNDGSVLWTLSI